MQTTQVNLGHGLLKFTDPELDALARELMTYFNENERILQQAKRDFPDIF